MEITLLKWYTEKIENIRENVCNYILIEILGKNNKRIWFYFYSIHRNVRG